MTVSIDVEAEGRLTNVRLRSVDVQGVAHVSLPEFIDQCGGYCRVEPARVNADLGGRSIVVGVNDTQVYTSRDRFSLDHPVIRHRDEVLIAVDDLSTLVVRGFAARLHRSSPETPVPAEEPEPFTEHNDETPVPSEPLTASAQVGDIPAPLPLSARDARDVPTTDTIRTVIIDPGHGGTDAGYVSGAGLAEKDLSLAVAVALREVLKETTDLKTYITRSEDATVSLRDRVDLAQREQGDLFVSIHAAVAASESAEGFGVYYAPPSAKAEALSRLRRRRPGLVLAGGPVNYSADSLRLARAIENAIASESGVTRHWVREAPVQVLRDAEMPGVLIEIGHLSNPAEAALLESRSQQEKVARGIARGIVAEFGGGAVPERTP